MSKPEDIPQDVWDTAEAHRQLWARGPSTIKEAVARAIMAERTPENDRSQSRQRLLAELTAMGQMADMERND